MIIGFCMKFESPASFANGADSSRLHAEIVKTLYFDLGMVRALPPCMSGWRSEEAIVAYQRSVQLRDQVIELTETGPVVRDYRFRDQIRSSAASAANNIREGFHRFNHGEFAHLASVSKASLAETRGYPEFRVWGIA
jgi:23S rRNA-intervening sequence protein